MAVTVTVEDGTGLAGANAYNTVALWKVFATQHGYDYSAYDDDNIGAAVIRTTSAIDARYRARFPGFRLNLRAQALEWPRTGAIDIYGYTITGNEVPVEIVNAVNEGVWRELQDPGVLAPDLERGGNVKAIKAGSVAIEYANNATAMTFFTAIDNALSGLLIAAGSYSGRAERV